MIIMHLPPTRNDIMTDRSMVNPAVLSQWTDVFNMCGSAGRLDKWTDDR